MTGPATVSLGRVAFLADGTWRADPAGAPAVLVPVHDRYGELADLIAWSPDKPSAWWLRYGDECPILGAADLAQTAWYQEPVFLYSTPERWLRARGSRLYHEGDHLDHQGGNHHQAICILHWGVELGPLFEGVSRIECDSPELRDRFRKAIRSWEPKITAPRQNLSPARSFREARDAA